MINLLPTIEKGKILKERKSRIMNAFLFFLSLFLIFTILGTLFVKINIQKEIEDTKAKISIANNGADVETTKSMELKIAEVNGKISKFSSYYSKKVYFTTVVDEILKTIPNGIVVNNINMAIKEGKVDFALTGFSPKREILFDFKKNIEENKNFANPVFPTSDWVKPENINFVASFEMPIK